MTGEAVINPDDAPAWLAERLRQIDEEIAELKGARSMRATTQAGGSYILSNDAGDVLWSFGSYLDGNGDPVYGIGARDDNGSLIFAFDDAHKGLIFPHEHHQWIVPTAQSISSGSFVAVAECEVVLPYEDTLTASAALIAPAGSVAECRIRDSRSGATTNTVQVDGFNGLVVFEWIHPFAVGWGDTSSPTAAPFLHWEVRLVSGAGPITAYPPRHLTFRNHLFSSLSHTNGGGRAYG